MLPSEIKKLKRNHAALVENLHKNHKAAIAAYQAQLDTKSRTISALEKQVKIHSKFRFYYALVILIILLQYLWSMV